MNKHLKLFANHSAYSRAESNLDKPNVAVCLLEGDIHYNPYVDPYNGHAYVDLGLPSGTKWATMNVGANNITDIGLYFQWGDTQGYTAELVGSGEGQKAFSWTDYKYSDNGTTTMIKYNSTDSLTTLLPEDDAATVAWGGSWKTPTKTQLSELISSSNTTKTWVTNYNGSGINGELITSKKNGNTLFFPVTGGAANGSISLDNNTCYLLSSIVTNDNTKFNAITGGKYSSFGSGIYFRYLGFTIRPVAD